MDPTFLGILFFPITFSVLEIKMFLIPGLFPDFKLNFHDQTFRENSLYTWKSENMLYLNEQGGF